MELLIRQTMIFSLYLALLVSPTTGWGERLHDDLNISHGKPLSTHQEEVLASTSEKILRTIARARTAIHDQNYSQAETDLHQAQILIASVKDVRPTARIRDRIQVARYHLDYESMEKVALDLIPIDMALTELSEFIPVEEAPSHLTAARKNLTKKDREAAKTQLEAVEQALFYTEVDLPLSATEQHVLTAITMLRHHNPQEADAALAAAENGVEYLSIRINSPITHAKHSLWAAMEAYTAGEQTAAKAHLKKAASWLARMVREEERILNTEARQLAAELTNLTNTIKDQGEGTRDSLHVIWRKLEALTEREAETTAANAHRQQAAKTNTALKVNLIEAKFHVSYAETYSTVARDKERVLTELKKAHKHLMAAAGEAEGTIRERIQAAEHKSTSLQQAIAGKKQHLARAFSELKTDLHQLLYTLPIA